MSNTKVSKSTNGGYIVEFERDHVRIQVWEQKNGRMVYYNNTAPGSVQDVDYQIAYYALHGELP